MREIWTLCFSFFKIGLFTFGGGYAMLPMMERELIEKNKWITNEEMLAYYAIAQCTPGVVALNAATFVGYKRKGVAGAVAATLSVALPSSFIILLIATFLSAFSEYAIVSRIFTGIRVCVGVLIINAVFRLIKAGVKGVLGVILLLGAFALPAFFSASPVFVILGAALCGIVFYRGKEATP